MARTAIDPSLLATIPASKISGLKVLQVVFAQTSTPVSSVNSSSYVDVVSVTITPTSASNRILLLVSGVWHDTAVANATAYMTIRRGTTDLAPSTGGFCQMSVTATGAGDTYLGASAVYIDSPATASAVTYNVSIRGNSATGTIGMPANGGNTGIVAVEVV